MLKEFAQYLVSLKENKTYDIHGDVYSDRDLVRIEPHIDRPTSISVSGLDSIVKLLRNELDFAVIDNVKGLEALRTVPLGKEEMAVVCRSDHRSGNSITLEELAGERLLLREKGSGTRDSIDTVFGAAGLTVSALLDSSSTYALLSCAREGLGVTILPRSLTAEALREGTLKELTVTDGAFFRRYYLAHHKNKYLTDSVRQVVQALRDCCRESGILA